VKVTRIACSVNLNAGKYAQLEEQARRLGRVRSRVWREYGSVSGAGVSDRTIRDRWMADGTAGTFGVLANAWKETVRDAVAGIAASRESAKARARRAVHRRIRDEAGRRKAYADLKHDRWAGDPYLRRLMRRHWKHGRNRTRNQIVVRSDQYKTFTLAEGGNVWLAVPGLERRQLVTIPLDTTVAPAGTLRLILRDGKAEVRGDYAKAARIRADNLGTLKRDRRSRAWQHRVRDLTFQAVHAVADKASVIVAEDLTRTFLGRKKLGKNTSRRLAAWTKGVTAEALQSVPDRRGSAVRLVNAAYTSQAVPFTNILGVRKGDRLHCTMCGAVWQADHAAAINILHRDGDPGITLHTPHTRVRQLIQERADRQRSRLPDQDSSTSTTCQCGERNIQPMLNNEQQEGSRDPTGSRHGSV
jgi:IS605 OrfB family transposase